ncbi:putative reverse transcriptase domain-containing protein [Tanacetum coccineum]
MGNPNMTMEKYIKFEEEKAHTRGRVFNWQTATYGKIRVDDDLYDLRSVEAEFSAIVIDDAFTPKDTLPCKSQVSTPVNDKIDFRISFDESDDEDYTIICDISSFSYKMILVNNLKTDLENDNEKAGIPCFLPPMPTTSYIDDLDFFNDFENEFPAILYNDAQTSKLDLLIEPILSPQHNDEFNLNDETSLFKYDEEEQSILYFNDLFPFYVIHPNDSKSDEDNDDNKIDIIQSLEGSAQQGVQTQSLDELRSPDFNLLSDQEYSEKEEAEAMAEIMKQYMSKTRTDYGSGVARPKIDNKAASRWLRNEPTGSIKTWEDLKTKFFNKYCPPSRTAKKIEEINNFQQEPDETLYQAWERFKELLMKCPQHYLTKIQEVILFYNRLGVPTRQILDSRGAFPTKTAEDAKKAIQEMTEYSQKWHN